MNFGAVRQLDAGNATGLLQDFRHAGIEPESCALGFRGAAQVMRGELRIGDIARGRPVDARLDGTAGRLAETVGIHALGRRETGQVELRQAAEDRIGIPILMRNVKFVAIPFVF